MAENVLPQSVRMPRLAPTFAHRRNQFQAVGHRAIGRHMLTFFLKEQVAAEKVSLVITLSLFAALITLRNIQTCSWLTRRAEALERSVVEVGWRRVWPSGSLCERIRSEFAAAVIIQGIAADRPGEENTFTFY